MVNLNPLQIVEGPVFALLGKSALDVSPDVLPADSVPFITAGGAWGGSWWNLGFLSDAGVNHGGLSAATTAVNSSQQRGSVTMTKGISTQTISFTMLEFSAMNLQAALGQGTIVSTTTADDLELTDDPVKYYALGIEAFGPNGRPLRMIYPAVIPEITGPIDHRIGVVPMMPVRFTRSGGRNANPHWHFLK